MACSTGAGRDGDSLDPTVVARQQYRSVVVDLPFLVQVDGGRQKTAEVPQLLSDGVWEQIVASFHRSWRKSSRSSASSWTGGSLSS